MKLIIYFLSCRMLASLCIQQLHQVGLRYVAIGCILQYGQLKMTLSVLTHFVLTAILMNYLLLHLIKKAELPMFSIEKLKLFSQLSIT